MRRATGVRMTSGSLSHRRVEPSISVNEKVTVSDGRATPQHYAAGHPAPPHPIRLLWAPPARSTSTTASLPYLRSNARTSPLSPRPRHHRCEFVFTKPRGSDYHQQYQALGTDDGAVHFENLGGVVSGGSPMFFDDFSNFLSCELKYARSCSCERRCEGGVCSILRSC